MTSQQNSGKPCDLRVVFVNQLASKPAEFRPSALKKSNKHNPLSHNTFDPQSRQFVVFVASSLTNTCVFVSAYTKERTRTHAHTALSVR
jgi:hypothetical protein